MARLRQAKTTLHCLPPELVALIVVEVTRAPSSPSGAESLLGMLIGTLPGLFTPDPTPTQAPAPALAPPTPAASGNSSDPDDVDLAEEVAAMAFAASPSAPSAPLDKSGDLGPEEDDDDEEEGSGAESYNEGNDSAGSSDEGDIVTFPDGLPSNTVMPLLFVSRPFLYATRQHLYRRISIKSVYHASLLLQSLEATQAAADPDNTLASLVRCLHFHFANGCGGPLSMERGGARLMFKLVQLCDLEDLALSSQFVKSATKPFLAALHGLTKLKRVEISSGRDDVSSCIVTVPRVLKLLASWPELEDLSVRYLLESGAGPGREEDEMWEDHYAALEDSEEDYEDCYSEDSDSDNSASGVSGGGGDGRTAKESLCEEGGDSTKGEKKQNGLKGVNLFEVDAPEEEIALLLQHSRETLVSLVLRPTPALTRTGLASLVLNFGVHLTEFSLDVASNWNTLVPLKAGTRKPTPLRPKDYEYGAPTEAVLDVVARHTFLLDALLPYLQHLQALRWNGPLASTQAFAVMAATVKTVAFTNSPGVSPLLLAKFLRKTVLRSTSYTKADGTPGIRKVPTKLAPGLQCLSVSHDDLHWSTEEVDSLAETVAVRDICLHLSESSEFGMPAAMLNMMGGGMGVPIQLGPLPHGPVAAAAGVAPAAGAPAAAAPAAGAAGVGTGAPTIPPVVTTAPAPTIPAFTIAAPITPAPIVAAPIVPAPVLATSAPLSGSGTAPVSVSASSAPRV